MSRSLRSLRLHRETVRELSAPELGKLAAGVALTYTCGKVTIPPTICGCTGTETEEICQTIGIFTCACSPC